MPRFRLGSVKLPFITEMMETQSIIDSSENSASTQFQIPSDPCPIPEECLQILQTLDAETLDKCIKAMRNGIAGSPTSTEKGVLRRIAKAIGIDDVIALSWSPTYKLYFP